MANQIIQVKEVKDLSDLCDYLKQETEGYPCIRVDFSESTLSLILGFKTGICSYEHGTAEPYQDYFLVRYFGMPSNAKKTFSAPEVENSYVATELRKKIEENTKTGKKYEKKGYRQVISVEHPASRAGVDNFFRFLAEVFKQKSAN